MAAPRSRRSNAKSPAVRSLMVRLDDESKSFLRRRRSVTVRPNHTIRAGATPAAWPSLRRAV